MGAGKSVREKDFLCLPAKPGERARARRVAVEETEKRDWRVARLFRSVIGYSSCGM